MSTNPNENGSYTVIHATKWSKGSKIEKKTRLVVLKFFKKEGRRFAVRWQTPPGDNGPTFGGASYSTAPSAYSAFLNKYGEHNKDFKKGNHSHLPGIAK